MNLKNKVKEEPVVTAEIIRVAGYILAGFVALGYFTPEQESELTGLIEIIAPVGAIILSTALAKFSRDRVSPTYKFQIGGNARLEGTDVRPE